MIEFPPSGTDGPSRLPPHTSTSLTTSDLPRLLRELVEVALAGRGVELMAWEQSSAAKVSGDLVPQVQHLCTRAVETLSHLDSALSAPDSAPTSDQHGDGQREAVQDVVWLARMELAQRASQLGAAGRMSGVGPMITLCESCLRKLRRTASNVEAVLAPLLGAKTQLRLPDGLTLSRQIRVLYAGFANQIEDAAEHDLATRLRRAAAAIARLMGRDVYRELRYSDRAEFAFLQRRLTDWHTGTQVERQEDGEHLWQDVAGFSSLLHQVNRRSELVEHDRAVVGGLLAELDGGAEGGEADPGEPASGPQILRLNTLRGRDPRLDALLAEGTAPRSAWIRCLQRLQRELDGTGYEA